MSPRTVSTSSASNNSPARSVSGPYPQRRASQPKSTRVQYAACGGRMRRVRCDLKDIPIASAGANPSCSNCSERGLKCVDEFAEVKAVKLLRRGRRLQQVEAIYGKASDPDDAFPAHPSARLPPIIPPLKVEFFSSPFWRWFSIQRPILDPNEFPARFIAHSKGSHPLGQEGGVLALLLVVWASSFGLDESGLPMDAEDLVDRAASQTTRRTSDVSTTKRPVSYLEDSGRRPRKDKTEAMLREILELIDFHSILRKPSWDGVRILLLLLPLLEDISALERVVLYEAALSQTHAICTFVPGPPHPLTSSEDPVIRARIFWYAYLQEGITTAVRGGRLVLSEDDLDTFQSTLPSFHVTAAGLPSPVSPSFPHTDFGASSPVSSGAAHPYLHLTRLFAIPLRLGATCRKLHSVLTGIKAATQIEQSSGLSLDVRGLQEVWDRLRGSWEEFEGVRNGGLTNGDVDTMVDRFVSSWQIYIFECHNIIRESLKQYLCSSPSASPTSMLYSSSSPHLPSHVSHSPSPALNSAAHLHSLAIRECLRLLPSTLTTIKRHLVLQADSDPLDSAGIFRWDTGLVRDGVFFAGYLAANLADDACFVQTPSTQSIHEGPIALKQETPDVMDLLTTGHSHHIPQPSSVGSAEEGVSICLSAIAEMQWAFSKSDEREENIRRLWDETQLRRHQQPQFTHSSNVIDFSYSQGLQPPTPSSFLDHPIYGMAESEKGLRSSQPLLSPLTVTLIPTRIESAPSTACSTDGSSSGWPSYTPPGTSTSATSAGTTNLSSGGSPVFPSLAAGGNIDPGFKTEGQDAFYSVTGDLDQFSFDAGVGYDQQARISVGASHLHPASGGPPTPSYLDFPPGPGSATSVLGADDTAHFGKDCSSGFYH